MAVDHDEAVIGLVEQEGLADPSEVGLALLFELNPGPDAGVDEQIITEAAAIGKALEELDVALGNGAAHHR